MIRYPFAYNMKVGTKTLELRRISKRAIAVYGIVFFKSRVDKRTMFGSKARFVGITQGSSGNTARVMVATVQPGLIDQRCLLEKGIFLFNQTNLSTELL
jgi:hypothetical protein